MISHWVEDAQETVFKEETPKTVVALTYIDDPSKSVITIILFYESLPDQTFVFKFFAKDMLTNVFILLLGKIIKQQGYPIEICGHISKAIKDPLNFYINFHKSQNL